MCSAIRPLRRAHRVSFLEKKTFLESPDQWISPDLYCKSFGHTHTLIWRLKMCSTIGPLPGAPCYNFVQKKIFLESCDQWISPELYFR